MNTSESSEFEGQRDDRLRYDEGHWARSGDQTEALTQYLQLADRPYNKTKFQLFSDLAGDLVGKRVLDYGGGAGILAVPFAKAGAHVTLVDAEENALNTALHYAESEGAKDRVQAIRSEVVSPSLRGQDFDIVLAKDIVEHIEDDEQFLRDLAECQGPGGTLLLSTHNSQSLQYLLEGSYERYWLKNENWLGWDITHVRFYNPGSLKRKLRSAGYRVDRWASAYVIPYDVLSWLSLLRLRIEVPALRYVDLTLGKVFPCNRLGWNIILRATKV